LMRHTDATRDLSWDHAAFQQVGRPHPTRFHGLMISLPDNASVRPSRVIVLYRNELTHASVSHQTPAVR
jgi:hypothetical protein